MNHLHSFLKGLLLISLFFIFSETKSQTELKINTNPSNCKAAFIRSDYPDNNYKTSDDFIGNAWTADGFTFVERSMMSINLSSIPKNAIIINATLSLYCNINSSNFQHQSPLSGSNACWLQRITSKWDDNTVTWNNQPTTSIQNKVEIPESISETQNYPNIDITNLVKDMVNYPDTSFGFMISLQTEVKYRCMVFASAQNLTDSLRPVFRITYKVNSVDSCMTIQKINSSIVNNVLGAEIRSDVPNTNYSNSDDFIGNAWTVDQNPLVERSLIKFDLNAIPSNAIIKSANLNLHCNTSSSNFQYQSPLSGSNACWLSKITSSWTENLVTWNNQPTISTENQVEIPESTSTTQDYPTIDITKLVVDMVSKPDQNFGFMISLENEEKYRCMVFASSKHAVDSLHPKLTICYTIPTTPVNVKELKTKENLSLFPNPANDILNIESNSSLAINLIVYDVYGNTLLETVFTGNNKLNIANFTKGLYLVRTWNSEFDETKKIIKN